MARHTKHAKKTRPRESDDVEFNTFAEQMDYWHIPCTGRTSSGRRVWRV